VHTETLNRSRSKLINTGNTVSLGCSHRWSFLLAKVGYGPSNFWQKKLLHDNPLDSYKAIQHKHMCYSIRMCVLYQTILTKIINKSDGYRIMPYNHVMILNLNIFKIVLSFGPPTTLVILHPQMFMTYQQKRKLSSCMGQNM
jgi:hypothetical protein